MAELRLLEEFIRIMSSSLILFGIILPFVLGNSHSAGQAKDAAHKPDLYIRYNITCPLRYRGFEYHMWMYTKPLEVTIVDVTNGYTTLSEHGQMRAQVPDRRMTDVRVGVAIKHNCNFDGEVKMAEEELGNCGINETSCTFYFSANLMELKNFTPSDL